MEKLSITDSGDVYIGSSHWATILEDIQNLKDEFAEDPSDDATTRQSTPYETASIHGSLSARLSLLNSGISLSRDQIMTMIPVRKVVDRHISRFFNTFDLAPVILHRRKFLAEYANFWANPSSVPTMWIGLLFSIMSMSAFLQQQNSEAFGLPIDETQAMLESYRTLTIHCLVSVNYLQPSRHTIETLILHFAVDQNVNIDADIGNWLLIGVVVRIALRMGLHRDPSHWPHIRPLQGELRRRIWIALYQMDFFTSTQVGLPRIIKDSQCDTRPPAHLFDDDISFEHDETPPERPLADPTPLSFIIHRNKIIKVAAEIYDVIEAAPPSPATISALSAKLQSALDDLPSWLQAKPCQSSIADNPVTMLNRIFVNILFHKAMYTLHKQNFLKSMVDKEGTESSNICVNSALSILEHQHILSEEMEPGGVMFNIRWKVATSLNHEFLQATMMLCLALTRFNVESADNNALQVRQKITDALLFTKSLWERNIERSSEARRAVEAITAVLKKDSKESNKADLLVSNELFGQMPGIGSVSAIGGLEYEQNIALDPSLFSLDDGNMAFENFFDDFVVT
ncbi:fungal-specific transcription factor domain-containing protein [Penicillium angulare]|uniref:fungal-specific transcription factor domain-containing protein n=1 Tax=Penicillium angulare TaxID=116970 RepID=UPI002541017E|nr:fungal-specific transcription factor domain-containing protein [Penicillium angulare]KAJ5291743.1 fungal-specific transcription factor domain-containing protein [Penicillium angulare]